MLVAILACSSKMTALFGEWVTTERANWEMLIPPIDFHRCNPTCLRWLMLALTIGQPMPLSPMVSENQYKRRQWLGISSGC